MVATGSNSVGVKLSGIDNKLDAGLHKQLQKIAAREFDYFYADSLKSISRNFEKLLMVFEFLLTRGAAVVTANYYFENGRVEKRKSLLKPLSNTFDIRLNMIRLDELSPQHRSVIKDLKG